MDIYNFILGTNQFDLHFSSSKKVACFWVYIYVSIQPFLFALRQIFGMIIVRKKGLDCNLSNLPNTLTLFNTYRNMVEHASSLPIIHLTDLLQVEFFSVGTFNNRACAFSPGSNIDNKKVCSKLVTNRKCFFSMRLWKSHSLVEHNLSAWKCSLLRVGNQSCSVSDCHLSKMAISKMADNLIFLIKICHKIRQI